MQDTISTIVEHIKSNDTIIIHRHVRPDLDAIGSQYGLAELIKHNFDNKTIYTPGEITGNFTQFVDTSTSVVPQDAYSNGALIIVLDTADKKRIDTAQEWSAWDTVIKIDHHPEQETYGDVSWVDTSFSSVSEMLTLFAQEAELELNDAAARLFYMGIIGDTGRFLYSNTTPQTLRAAALLMEQDFSPNDLVDKMNVTSLAESQLYGWALGGITFNEKSGLGIMRITQDVLRDFGLTADNTYHITNAPKNIDGMKIWMLITELEKGDHKISIRSNGVTINDIAAEFGGGGHKYASGVIVKTEQIVPLIDKLYERGLES